MVNGWLSCIWVFPLGAAIAGCGDADHVTIAPGGSLELYASAKRCPIIDAYSANPAVTGVGESVALASSAEQPEGTRPVSFLWLASSGSFVDSESAVTSYTCAAVGIQTITLIVTDGSCVDYANLPIGCVAAR